MDVLAQSTPPSSAVCLKCLPWVILRDQDWLLMGMNDPFSYRKRWWILDLRGYFQKRDSVMTLAIKKYVMGVFLLKWGEENKTFLCTMSQVAHKGKFKSPMLLFSPKKLFVHPIFTLLLASVCCPGASSPKQKIMVSCVAFDSALYSSFSIFCALNKDYKFYPRL